MTSCLTLCNAHLCMIVMKQVLSKLPIAGSRRKFSFSSSVKAATYTIATKFLELSNKTVLQTCDYALWRRFDSCPNFKGQHTDVCVSNGIHTDARASLTYALLVLNSLQYLLGVTAPVDIYSSSVHLTASAKGPCHILPLLHLLSFKLSFIQYMGSLPLFPDTTHCFFECQRFVMTITHSYMYLVPMWVHTLSGEGGTATSKIKFLMPPLLKPLQSLPLSW